MSFTANQLGFNKDVNQYAVSSIIPFPYGVGLEIELEFKGDIPEARVGGRKMQYWNMTTDGSLKHGMEFVTVSPLISGSIVKALTELNLGLKEQKVAPILSERTSVHVHVDARDMSKEQISNFILLYLVFEKVLFQYCGADRAKNVFCLSAMDSDGIVEAMVNFFTRSEVDAAYGLRNYQRYSSLNLQSLTKFGSIEVRAHRGEHKVRQLTNWVNLLLSIKHFVMHNDTIWDNLVNHISEIGVGAFTNSVFGKYSKNIMHDGYEQDVLEGVRVAQNVIYSDNFDKIEGEINTSQKEPPIFLNYMSRKYPALYKEKLEISAIKKTIRGKEDTYSVDIKSMTVSTTSNKKHKLHYLEEDGWFFVNELKTKVLLSKAYQDHLSKKESTEKVKKAPTRGVYFRDDLIPRGIRTPRVDVAPITELERILFDIEEGN
jgi:hypothetical protein